jgi:biotin operon repressor
LNELRNEKSISRVKFRKIVESLKSKGVDKKDIKSGLYNIRFGHTIGMSGEDINKEVDLHFEDRQPRVHPKVRASRSPYRGPAEGRRL